MNARDAWPRCTRLGRGDRWSARIRTRRGGAGGTPSRRAFLIAVRRCRTRRRRHACERGSNRPQLNRSARLIVTRSTREVSDQRVLRSARGREAALHRAPRSAFGCAQTSISSGSRFPTSARGSPQCPAASSGAGGSRDCRRAVASGLASQAERQRPSRRLCAVPAAPCGPAPGSAHALPPRAAGAEDGASRQGEPETRPGEAAGRHGLNRVCREGILVGQSQAQEITWQQKADNLSAPVRELIKPTVPCVML